MRPIHLQIEYFGAFAKKVEIDFESLGKKGLFLVYGPTGSGKTTIFDAICMALFGKTTSGREFEDMRSQYSETNSKTKVELVFASGIKKFYIKRELTKNKKSVFYQIDNEKEKNAIQEPVTAEKEIARLIKSILGFSAEQFKQIIVLPQGEFSKFLKANSTQKEPILSQLFGTEIFDKVVENLKDKNKQTEIHISGLKEQKSAILNSLHCNDIGGLESLCGYTEKEIQRIHLDTESLKQEEQKLNQAYQSALQLHKCFQEWEEKTNLYNQKLLFNPYIEDLENKIELAQKARIIHPHIALNKQLKAKIAQMRANIQDIENKRDEKRKEFENMRTEFQIKKPQIEAQEIKAQSRLAFLENSIPLFNSIEQNQKKIDDLEAEFTRLKKEISDDYLQIDKLKRGIVNLQTEQENNLILSQKIDITAIELTEIDTKIKQRNLFDIQAAQLNQVRQQFEQQTKSAQVALLAVGAAKADYHRIESQWIESQAAELALSLSKGQPCPVCGSTEHPKKAARFDDFIDRNTKEHYKNIFLEKETEYEKQKTLLEATKIELSKSQVLCEELKTQVFENLSDLQSRKQQLLVQFKSYQKAKELLEKNKIELTDTQNRLDLLQGSLEHKNRHFSAVTAQIDEKKAVLKKEKENLPDKIESLTQLEQAIDKGKIFIQNLRTEKEKLQNSIKNLEIELEKLKTSLQELTLQYHLSTKQFDQQQKELELLMSRNGFLSLEQAEAALLPTEQIAQYHTQIQTHKNELLTLRTQIQTLQNQIADRQRPDVKATEELYRQTQEKYMQSIRQESILKTQLQSQKQALQSAGQIASELMEVEEPFGELKKLESLISGKNAQAITLGSYVLGALLDEVLHYTNLRLKAMSAGRYQIFRMQPTQRQGGARQGLDLEVFDAYTAQRRNVNHLSGGETFFTSLALALGLADAASVRNGGIKIEALFIDEGFGTLDTHTLDLAIDTLTELESPHRLVGIISHVPELKERIAVHLEVVKTSQGSTVKMPKDFFKSN